MPDRKPQSTSAPAADSAPRTVDQRPDVPGTGQADILTAELWPFAAAALPLAASTMLTAWCWIPLTMVLIAAASRVDEIRPLLATHRPGLRPVLWQAGLTGLALLMVLVALLSAIVEFGQAVVAPGIAALNLPGIAEPVSTALDSWFNATTAGLPVTAGELAVMWAAALGITIIGGCCGFRGAQLGFGLLAGATVAMVWQGAAVPEQRPALLLAVLVVFAVLAIPVLRRP